MSENPEHVARGQPTLSPTGPRLRLAVTGPAGRIDCETQQAVTLIGSRRDCHLPVNDPDVSKVHCAVVHTGLGFLACDLCSRGGTYVNGRAVRVAPLRAGDRLRVGAVDIDVADPDPMPSAGAADDTVDATRPARLALSVEGRTLRLVSDDGPDRPGAVNLLASAALVGRRSTCDVVADTPDVSLVHALIFTHDGRPVVADLGSRSGTLLNGQRVQLAWLHNGDELNIGGQKLRVSCDDAARAMLSDRPAAISAPLADLDVVTSADPAVPDANAVEELMQAVLGDLSSARVRLDERAAELEKRQAELDTLAALLKLQSEHLEKVKAELSRRATEVEQVAEEAQQRLATAVSREQAVAAVWAELDRWYAAWEPGQRADAKTDSDARPAPRGAAGLSGLPDAPPMAQAFPPPVPPPTAGGGSAANV